MQKKLSKKAQNKLKIVTFFRKYGLQTTLDAFHEIKKSSIYRWNKVLKEKGNNPYSLEEKSKRPKHFRKVDITEEAEEYIVNLRKTYGRIGKEKIAYLLKEENIAHYSASKVGRILSILKKKRKIQRNTKISFYARTGKIVEREKTNRRKKLRRKGFKDNLIQVDTIILFNSGIKKYVLTATSTEDHFSFAYTYNNHSSQSAKDFFKKLERVYPKGITHVQTDNGSEFEKYFRNYLEQQNIIHFNTYPRCPQQNGNIERFNRTLKEEFINLNRNYIRNTKLFNKKMTEYLIWYNTKRPHHSLELLSPVKYIISNLPVRFSNMLWTST